VSAGAVNWTVPQSEGAYTITLPDGAFRLNATVTTTEFGTQMNYTADRRFTIDFENLTIDLNFTKVRKYTVAFEWEKPVNQSLPQGASVNYTATVRNTGTENATFDFAVPTPPPGWSYTLGVNNVTLDIGGNQTFWILINTSNQTRAGKNTLALRAAPRNVSGLGGSVDFEVMTRQDWGIDARPDVDAPADQGASTTYFLAIENKGNGVDKVQVRVTGLPPGYTGTPDKGAPGNELEVQPFTTGKVLITVARNVTAPVAPPGSAFVVSVQSVSNATESDSVVFTMVYADLHVASSTNATRASEPGKGNIVVSEPLTTPGFEVGAAAAAFALLAVAARVRRRGGMA